MATAPYGVRLLLGAAMTALEETRRLPQTILTYPMTIVSQVAHLVMKVQQDVADLVIKGDETLDSLFPPKDEQPGWATFDEDGEGRALDDEPGAELDPDAPRNGERLTEGRFALYSTGEPEPREDKPAKNPGPAAPAIVADLDYGSLTLAQLRARLPQLKVADLEGLLAYEGNTLARAPFQTLLANRITRANAKMTKPVAALAQSNYPVAALAQSNYPVAALALSNYPVAALAQSNYPVAALAQSNYPVAALAQSNYPVAALAQS